MASMRPVAGVDIKPGMTISLRPGDKPFEVTRIVPSDISDLAGRLAFLYSGDDIPEHGATFLNHWFVEMTS